MGFNSQVLPWRKAGHVERGSAPANQPPAPVYGRLAVRIDIGTALRCRRGLASGNALGPALRIH